MADSFTPNLNLRKPEVGAAFDTWGGVAGLNNDLDLLDAVFLATGLGTSVGLHVGTGKVLNVEGQLQLADSTDTTKRTTFSVDLVPTATTIDLKIPPAGGTIATKEILVATVTAAHPVGTVLSGYYGATPPSGYVFVDGRTIGDATSLATNRANLDCERLFLHLWGLGMAVVTGRGATAAADWSAHKQLILPNHSGRTVVGRDNLSGTAAGVLSGYTSVGVAGGAQTHTLAWNEMPVHAHAVGNHRHRGEESFLYTNHGFLWGHVVPSTGNYVGGSTYTGYMAEAADTGGAGSGWAHNNIQPSIAVDVIMAL